MTEPADSDEPKARGLLSGKGHELSASSLESLSETLHAAALDEEARKRVQDGCLDRELRHIGLGGLTAVTARKPGPSRSRAKTPDPARADRAARVREARSAEAEARRQMEHAERELRRAQERRHRAAAALEDADQAMAGARELHEEALARHERAQRALEELAR